MSERHDTYGWRNADVDVIAEQVGRALLVPLEPRSSLYRGEYYNWRGAGSAQLVLQENFLEEDDGLPTYDEFADHTVLLFASSLPAAWFERLGAIPGAELLRSEVLS